MTTTQLARALASCAVLCTAMPGFAQNQPAVVESRGLSDGGTIVEAKCPVMHVTRPAAA